MPHELQLCIENEEPMDPKYVKIGTIDLEVERAYLSAPAPEMVGLPENMRDVYAHVADLIYIREDHDAAEKERKLRQWAVEQAQPQVDRQREAGYPGAELLTEAEKILTWVKNKCATRQK